MEIARIFLGFFGLMRVRTENRVHLQQLSSLNPQIAAVQIHDSLHYTDYRDIMHRTNSVNGSYDSRSFHKNNSDRAARNYLSELWFLAGIGAINGDSETSSSSCSSSSTVAGVSTGGSSNLLSLAL